MLAGPLGGDQAQPHQVRHCRLLIGVDTREAAMEWAMGNPPAPRCQ
jgi:hypothetical protein